MMTSQRRKTLLEGSVWKSILLIALPVTFANILQTVYQLIDTFWVGRLGTDAVAAVSLSFPILFFLMSLAMGMATAGAILVSQHNGKNEPQTVSLVTAQTLTLVTILSFCVACIGYWISPLILSYMTEDTLLWAEATSYLQISFWGMPAMFCYMIFQSSLRGVGEVRFPMIVILGTVILNFFLDPLFLFGWGKLPPLGITGVAYATIITEYLSALIGFISLFIGIHGVHIQFRQLIPQKKWIHRLFVLGFPSSIEMSSRSLGAVLMTFLVSTLGTLAVASYGIGSKVLSFVILPALGFAIASSSLVGNNLGAQQHERTQQIIRTGMHIAFGVLSFIGMIAFVGAETIAHFFVPEEKELIIESALFIRIMALSFGFIGGQMVINGTFKAAGMTGMSMFFALFQTFVLFVTGYLLSTIFQFGMLGIWIAHPISNIAAFALAFSFYRQKQWLQNTFT